MLAKRGGEGSLPTVHSKIYIYKIIYRNFYAILGEFIALNILPRSAIKYIKDYFITLT